SSSSASHRTLPSFPTRRSSDLHLDDPKALEPLDDEPQGPVGLLERLVDDDDGPNRVEPRGIRCLLGGVALQHRSDEPAPRERLFDQAQGGRAPRTERNDRAREDDGIPERQDGQDIGYKTVLFIPSVSHASPFSTERRPRRDQPA